MRSLRPEAAIIVSTEFIAMIPASLLAHACIRRGFGSFAFSLESGLAAGPITGIIAALVTGNAWAGEWGYRPLVLVVFYGLLFGVPSSTIVWLVVRAVWPQSVGAHRRPSIVMARVIACAATVMSLFGWIAIAG